MQTTHRIPWQRLAYGYSEVVHTEGEPVDFAKLALEALTMEDSYLASLGTPVGVDYDPEFAPDHAEHSESRDYSPGNDHRGHSQPRQGGQRPSGGQTANRYGVTLKCPDHGDVLVPSTKNKDMDWIKDLGKEIPASWFHSLPDGKSHTVYQSKAIWA